MKRTFLFLFISFFSVTIVYSQNFTLREMMKISKLKSSDFEKAMKEKEYTLKTIDSSNNSNQSIVTLFEWKFFKVNLNTNDTSFIYLSKLTAPDSTIKSFSIKANENFKNIFYKNIIDKGFVFIKSYTNDVNDRDKNIFLYKSITNYYKKNSYEIAINEHKIPEMESDNIFEIMISYSSSGIAK
jgi:hypothetical protein